MNEIDLLEEIQLYDFKCVAVKYNISINKLKNIYKKNNKIFNKQLLQEELFSYKITQIAEKYNVKYSMLYNFAIENKLQLHKQRIDEKNILQNINLLQLELKDLSLREISIKYKVKYANLYTFAKKHKLNVSYKNNGKSKSSVLLRKDNKMFNFAFLEKGEEIIDLYVNRNLSLYDIANYVGSYPTSILKFLRNNDVKIRLRSGKYEYKAPKYSKDLLVELYYDKNLSLYQIAELLDYKSHANVVEDFKFYNIQRRNYSEAGKNCAKMRPDVVEKWKIGLDKCRENGFVSSLEHKFMAWANKNVIEYIHQFQLYEKGHRYDFFLPKYNLIVEVDGVYWHSTPEAKRLDMIFEKIARKHNKKLIRFTDLQIKENNDIFNIIMEKYNAN